MNQKLLISVLLYCFALGMLIFGLLSFYLGFVGFVGFLLCVVAYFILLMVLLTIQKNNKLDSLGTDEVINILNGVE